MTKSKLTIIISSSALVVAAAAFLVWHFSRTTPSGSDRHVSVETSLPATANTPSSVAVPVTTQPVRSAVANPVPAPVVDQPDEADVEVEELADLPRNKAELLKFIELIRKVPGSRNRAAEMMFLGEAMGAEDFEGSLAMLAELENPDGLVRNLYYGLFTSKAFEDPQGAIVALEGLEENDRAYMMAMNGLTKGWGRADLRGALDYVHSLDKNSRAMAIRGVYRAWGEQDGASATQAVMLDKATFSRTEYYLAMSQVFHGWAQTDPMAALAHVEGMEGSREKSYWLKSIGDGLSYTSDWAPGQEKATAEWMMQSLPDIAKRSALPSLYDRWAMSDPEAAIEHAATLGADQVRDPDDLVGDVLSSWYLQDPNTALAWAQGLQSDPEGYQSVLAEAAQRLSRYEPEAAAGFIDRFPDLLKDDKGVIYGLIRQWTREDPHAASNWALTIPDEGSRGWAMKSAYADWARQDLASALEGAAMVPEGNERAYAMSNVAVAQGRAGFFEESTWITDMAPGFTRDRSAAGYVLGSLRQHDRRAAASVKAALGDQRVNMVDVSRAVQNARIEPTLRNQLLQLVRQQ